MVNPYLRMHALLFRQPDGCTFFQYHVQASNGCHGAVCSFSFIDRKYHLTSLLPYLVTLPLYSRDTLLAEAPRSPQKLLLTTCHDLDLLDDAEPELGTLPKHFGMVLTACAFALRNSLSQHLTRHIPDVQIKIV